MRIFCGYVLVVDLDGAFGCRSLISWSYARIPWHLSDGIAVGIIVVPPGLRVGGAERSIEL